MAHADLSEAVNAVGRCDLKYEGGGVTARVAADVRWFYRTPMPYSMEGLSFDSRVSFLYEDPGSSVGRFYEISEDSEM